jgi:hypothetical protein
MKRGQRNNVDKVKEQMLEALRKHMGLVTTSCLEVGIERSTHYDWLKNDPEYAEQVAIINEKNIDIAESKLFEKIQNGSETSIFYFLNNKGKSRGYNLKDPYEDGEKKIVININSPLTNDDVGSE